MIRDRRTNALRNLYGLNRRMSQNVMIQVPKIRSVLTRSRMSQNEIIQILKIRSRISQNVMIQILKIRSHSEADQVSVPE